MAEAAPASEPAAAPAAAPAPAPAAAPAAPAAPAAAPAPAVTTLLTAPPAAAPAPAADGKPADAPAADDGTGKPAETKKDDDTADAHAPEAYEPFKLEGDAQLDDAFLGTFKPLAKELDLPQAKAEKLAQLAQAESTRLATKFVTDLRASVDANAAKWENEVKADAELGGDKHAEVMATAKRAMDKFGSDEFKTFLNETRLGNNPALLRLLYRVGKTISQDDVDPGRAGGTRDAASVLYGNTPKGS